MLGGKNKKSCMWGNPHTAHQIGVGNMKIRVYQINSDRDINRLGFMSYEFVMKHGWEPSLYDVVFDGEIGANTLEEIYEVLNVGRRPENYKGYSLSVSDVCEIIKNGESKFYYCDSFGWVEIDFTV